MPDSTLALARMLLDAAVLAFAATLLFLLIAEAALFVGSRMPRRSIFGKNMLNRPGADERNRFGRARDRYLLYMLATIMFMLTLVITLLAHPDPLVRALPPWVQIVSALLVVMGVLHLIVRAVFLNLEQKNLQHRLEAFESLGEVLGRIASRGYRIFYSLVGRSTVIDAVVVGSNGIFSIMVVLAPSSRQQRRGQTHVDFDGKRVSINGKPGRTIVPRARHNTTWLADRLSRVLGHSVVVRTLIVAPGAHVKATPTEDCLLVPEDRLAVLTGWTSQEAYMMEDDMEKITRWLERNCRASNLRHAKKIEGPGSHLRRQEDGAPA